MDKRKTIVNLNIDL